MILNLTRPLALFEKPSTKNTPLSLTEVSRRWRQMTLACPELWTSLEAVIEMDSPDYTKQIEQWLRRSHPFPLSLRLIIEGDEDTDEYNEQVGHGVFNVFQAFRARWRNIYIQWAPGHEIPFAEIEGDSSAPLLTSVILRTQVPDFVSFSDQWSKLSDGSPSLTDFLWSDPEMELPDFDFSKLRLDQKALTHLELDVPMSVLQGLEVLSKYPDLIFFSFRVANAPGPELLDEKREVVDHRSLRTLRVVGSRNVSYFLDTVAMPRLMDVYIDYDEPVSTAGWEGEHRFDPDSFINFIQSIHLKSLYLRIPVNFNEETCINMLGELPMSIEHLHFENLDLRAPGCIGTDFFRLMVSPRVPSYEVEPPDWLLFPYLRCLSLIAVTCKAEPGIIIRMIDSRGHFLHSGGAADFRKDQEIEIQAFPEHHTKDFIELQRRAKFRPDLYSFTILRRPGVNYNGPEVRRRIFEICKRDYFDWAKDEKRNALSNKGWKPKTIPVSPSLPSDYWSREGRFCLRD